MGRAGRGAGHGRERCGAAARRARRLGRGRLPAGRGGPPCACGRAVDVPRLRERLAWLVGEAHVRSDEAIRPAAGRGKLYLDLLALRAGDAGEAPDLVVAPGSADEVGAVLAACAEARRGRGAVRRRDERGRRSRGRAGRLRCRGLPRPGAARPGAGGRRAVTARRGRRRDPGSRSSTTRSGRTGCGSAITRRATSGRPRAAARRPASPARPRRASAASTTSWPPCAA